MSLIHHAGVRNTIKKRVETLSSDAQRKWGRMTVDQMLWHVNRSLAESLGEYTGPAQKPPIPRKLLRWLALNIPWPRGARTRPDLLATQRHDFNLEKLRCLAFIDRVSSRDMNAVWPRSAGFGEMTGRHWSRLHAKHLDHHLKQFGA
jgi:hypothetical protein